MTRRPERNFYEQLRRNLPKAAQPLHLQRVENVAQVGHPDLNYCIAGIEGNAELKAFERIRFSGRFTIPKLREEQGAWLATRCAAGGRAYLLTRMNKDVILIDGRLVPDLFNKSLHLEWGDAHRIVSCWLRPPIDWTLLTRALVVPPLSTTAIEHRRSFFQPRPVSTREV